MITLALGALLAQAAPAAPKPVVLTHANVIDVRSGRPIPDATLVLSGGKIELEAIQSATTVAAELLGVERRTGSVQEGFEADLIVVGA